MRSFNLPTHMTVMPVLIFATSTFFIKCSYADTKAPELYVSEWINKDPGMLRDMRGKVVVIDFFQMWCPGCNSFSIPLISRWEERYKGQNDIIFLSIHTVFEGHQYQTPDALKDFVKRNGISHPVGIDAYGAGSSLPITMRKYRTGGTPCITIIDKDGNIRFQKLGGFNPEPVERLIDQLLMQ